MKNKKPKYNTLSKYKEPKYSFSEFDYDKTKVVSKSDIGDRWPLIGIDEVIVYYFYVDITIGGKKTQGVGITCYDQDKEIMYSLNGLAKSSIGYSFPYEAGIVKLDDTGNFMDIEALK